MELTTGAILRRITETPLSVSAHKLATIILDGIAWKDGYNGLVRGTAAFTLRHLAEKMGISRQHLFVLLTELSASSLMLTRSKPNGKFAPWLFSFGAATGIDGTGTHPSSPDDRSLFEESQNKMIFAGRIEIEGTGTSERATWVRLIQAAKKSLPCWNVDPEAIWEAFLAFNRARQRSSVPAGFLLGFMRKWRSAGSPVQAAPATKVPDNIKVASELARLAPVKNWWFHQRDLMRRIGTDSYQDRLRSTQAEYGLSPFAAALTVHGVAVQAGEIAA